MFYRIIYTCVKAWKHRKILATYVTNHSLQAETVAEISTKELLDKKVQALIIDFDGVLASYAKIEPTIESTNWLRECCKIFGPNRIFILSNKPTMARKQYFTKYFPGVNFVLASYKKPFPDSILQIIYAAKLLPEETLVIDDRLLTGILAAVISNAHGCLITKPLIDYKLYPIQEKIYDFIRRLEQKVFRH